MDALEVLRQRIDETDRQLLETLAERLRHVAEVGRLKTQGLAFLRDHDREARLLSRVESQARELGLDPFRATEIFREIIAMSVKVQEEVLLDRRAAERSLGNAHRVAFPGAAGSSSHRAARKYFGDRAADMTFTGVPTFAEALARAESGEAGYAFLPIENTAAGSINETYDLLRRTDLRITGEEILEVGARGAAEHEEGWTRFVVVSAIPIVLDPRIPSKTSLVFSTPHRRGALAHCLNVLDAHGLNLTKLESRPVPRHPWEYVFYVDFEGADTEDAPSRAIAALQRECPYVKVLGSYPARTTEKGRVDRLPRAPR